MVSNTGIVGGPLSSVTVPAGGSTDLALTLNVPVGTVGNSTAFREVAGMVTLTPASASDNNGVTLRVPYYLVPRALSSVSTGLSKFNASGNATATIRNKGTDRRRRRLLRVGPRGQGRARQGGERHPVGRCPVVLVPVGD